MLGLHRLSLQRSSISSSCCLTPRGHACSSQLRPTNRLARCRDYCGTHAASLVSLHKEHFMYCSQDLLQRQDLQDACIAVCVQQRSPEQHNVISRCIFASMLFNMVHVCTAVSSLVPLCAAAAAGKRPGSGSSAADDSAAGKKKPSSKQPKQRGGNNFCDNAPTEQVCACVERYS